MVGLKYIASIYITITILLVFSGCQSGSPNSKDTKSDDTIKPATTTEASSILASPTPKTRMNGNLERELDPPVVLSDGSSMQSQNNFNEVDGGGNDVLESSDTAARVKKHSGGDYDLAV